MNGSTRFALAAARPGRDRHLRRRAAFAWKATRPAPVAVRARRGRARPGRNHGGQHARGLGRRLPPRQARAAARAGASRSSTVREGDRVKAGPAAARAVERRPGRARAGVARAAADRRARACARPASSPTTPLRDAARARELRDAGFHFGGRAWTAPRATPRREQASCESARAQVEEAEARIRRFARRHRAHGAARALRRHRRRGERRGGRVPDAVAARHPDAAGGRPDRRLLPLRLRADRRGGRGAAEGRHDRPHHAGCLPRPALSRARCGASRPTCSRWRSRRAPWRWRSSSTARARRATCWWATARTSRSWSPRATACCASRPRR